jgi:hypothetical protein
LSGQVSFIRDLGANVEILVRVGDIDIISICAPQSRPSVKMSDRVGLQILTGRATVLAA